MKLPDFLDTDKCPRCKEAHHGLYYLRLVDGPTTRDGRLVNFWAFCPVREQPILVHILEPYPGPKANGSTAIWTF